MYFISFKHYINLCCNLVKVFKIYRDVAAHGFINLSLFEIKIYHFHNISTEAGQSRSNLLYSFTVLCVFNWGKKKIQ